jgi:ABC-type antimicrobial peptide transport system permease subunit
LPQDQLWKYPILIRTVADPKTFLAAISPVISCIDPDIVATSSTFEEMLRQTPVFFVSTFSALIATIVGLLGLLLASMGIYGTVSYVVVLRTREVGIRIALGANKSAILGIMLRSSMRPVLAGLGTGMLIAMGASTLLHGVLHGLSATDGLSVAVVSGIFLAIALLAAYLPSRRAMNVDPMIALRYE